MSSLAGLNTPTINHKLKQTFNLRDCEGLTAKARDVLVKFMIVEGRLDPAILIDDVRIVNELQDAGLPIERVPYRTRISDGTVIEGDPDDNFDPLRSMTPGEFMALSAARIGYHMCTVTWSDIVEEDGRPVLKLTGEIFKIEGPANYQGAPFDGQFGIRLRGLARDFLRALAEAS